VGPSKIGKGMNNFRRAEGYHLRILKCVHHMWNWIITIIIVTLTFWFS